MQRNKCSVRWDQNRSCLHNRWRYHSHFTPAIRIYPSYIFQCWTVDWCVIIEYVSFLAADHRGQSRCTNVSFFVAESLPISEKTHNMRAATVTLHTGGPRHSEARQSGIDLLNGCSGFGWRTSCAQGDSCCARRQRGPTYWFPLWPCSSTKGLIKGNIQLAQVSCYKRCAVFKGPWFCLELCHFMGP